MVIDTSLRSGDEVIVRCYGDYRHARLRGFGTSFPRWLTIETTNGRLISRLVERAAVRSFDAELWAKLEPLQGHVDEAEKKIRAWRNKQRKLWGTP